MVNPTSSSSLTVSFLHTAESLHASGSDIVTFLHGF